MSNNSKLAYELSKYATANRGYAATAYLRAARNGVLLPPVGDLRLSILSNEEDALAYTDARIHAACMESPKYARFHKDDSVMRSSVARVRLLASGNIAAEAKYYELGLLPTVSEGEYYGTVERPVLGSLLSGSALKRRSAAEDAEDAEPLDTLW